MDISHYCSWAAHGLQAPAVTAVTGGTVRLDDYVAKLSGIARYTPVDVIRQEHGATDPSPHVQKCEVRSSPPMARPALTDGSRVGVVVDNDVIADVMLEQAFDRHLRPAVPPRWRY